MEATRRSCTPHQERQDKHAQKSNTRRVQLAPTIREPEVTHLEVPKMCFGKAGDQRREQKEVSEYTQEEWTRTGRTNTEVRQQVTDEEGASWVTHQRGRHSSKQRADEDPESCADICCCYIIWVFAALIGIFVLLMCLHFMTSVI